MGAQSKSIIINVPPDKFYQVISDYEAYPEFLSSVKNTEIVQDEGNVKDVFYEIDLIKTIKYTLRCQANPPYGLSWSLVDGDMFKLNNGSWKLEPAEGGKATKATYSTEVDFTMFVPKMITNKLTAVSLPTTLKEFKERAESLFA